MEPTTLGATALAAYLSKDGLSRLLGPTADYLGNELRDLVAKSQRNVGRIFSLAEEKTPNLDEPGAVSPRVFRRIFEEGRFCEDEMVASYFGGVLASSRTDSGDDDSGVYYSQIVESLSSHQVKFHYFFYYLIWLCAKGRDLNLYQATDRKQLSIMIPVECYAKSFSVDPSVQELATRSRSLSGLCKASLIGENYAFGWPEELRKYGGIADVQAFKIDASLTGIELFLWAHGRGRASLKEFLSPTLISKPELPLHSSELAYLLADRLDKKA